MAITSFSWKNFPTTGGITTGGIGSATTNLCTSDGTNKATSCGFGRFFDPRAYKWESEIINIPTEFRASNTYSTGFTFSVKFLSSAVTPNSKWSIFFELVQVTGTGPVTYGTVYPLSDASAPGALLERTDEPVCEVFNYSPGTDPDNGVIPAGNYVLRIRFVTSNAVSSNNVCFDFDDIGLVIATNLSGDYEGDATGFNQPSWDVDVTSVSVDSSGRLVASDTLTKSAQSSVTCNDNGSANGILSHCAVPSVKAIHYTIGYPKSQSGYDVIPFIASIEEKDIPYQSGAYTWTKTNVVHEDADNLYVSFFVVPEWSPNDNYTFINSVYEVPTPSKPARTLTINYLAGEFFANLSGPITANLTVSGFTASGYPANVCSGSPIESDTFPSSTILAGGTVVSDTSGGLSCSSNRRKLGSSGTVAGTGLSHGQTVNVNGHVITLSINTSCVPNAC